MYEGDCFAPERGARAALRASASRSAAFCPTTRSTTGSPVQVCAAAARTAFRAASSRSPRRGLVNPQRPPPAMKKPFPALTRSGSGPVGAGQLAGEADRVACSRALRETGYLAARAR